MTTQEGSEARDPDQRSFAIEVPVPWAATPIKVRGLGVALTLLAIGQGIMAYVLWHHTADTDRRLLNVEASMGRASEIAAFQACILTLEMPERKAQWQAGSFCHQRAKGGLP